MKENNEKKERNSKENSKLIKAFPKHIAALDKRSVLQEKGREWKFVRKVLSLRCKVKQEMFQTKEVLDHRRLALLSLTCGIIFHS